jgi:hypothetical protein
MMIKMVGLKVGDIVSHVNNNGCYWRILRILPDGNVYLSYSAESIRKARTKEGILAGNFNKGYSQEVLRLAERVDNLYTED